jgi:hypothetical protein
MPYGNRGPPGRNRRASWSRTIRHHRRCTDEPGFRSAHPRIAILIKSVDAKSFLLPALHLPNGRECRPGYRQFAHFAPAGNFIDSTGVGVLVGVWHRVRGTDDCLALAAPSRQARNILETTGLMRVLPVYDTEAEAVQACREPAAQ